MFGVVFWSVVGLVLAIPSMLVLLSEHSAWCKKYTEKHFFGGRDMYAEGAWYAYPIRLLGWPTLVSGLLMFLPTGFWWDFLVGFAAMAMYELYQFLRAKRQHAELQYETALSKRDRAAGKMERQS